MTDYIQQAHDAVADYQHGDIQERPATNSTPLVEFNGPLWKSPNLKRWIRIRGLTDPGCPILNWSYSYAELVDGSIVYHRGSNELPFEMQACEWGQKRGWKSRVVAEAKASGVFLKGTGLFDALSILC